MASNEISENNRVKKGFDIDIFKIILPASEVSKFKFHVLKIETDDMRLVMLKRLLFSLL